MLGSPALRPINWAAWAGEAEKDMRRPKGQKRFENDGGTEGVSMAYLEDRRGFCDIRVSPKSIQIIVFGTNDIPGRHKRKNLRNGYEMEEIKVARFTLFLY